MEFNATFFATAISFIVFVFIMNAICYKPISKMVEDRQKFIDETNLVAKNNLEQSEALLKDKEEKIIQTKQETKKVISEKTETAQQIKKDMQIKAQQESIKKVEAAKNELLKAKDEAQNNLYEQLETLANEVSSKVLG